MKRLKVIRIITRMNIGGPALQAVLLSAEMPEDVCQTTLVTGSVRENEGNMMYLAEEAGVEPVIIRELAREISPFSDIIAFWKLFRFLKKEQPDIVHTHMAKAGMLGRCAARLAGVPVIIHTFHGHVFRGYFGPRISRFFMACERFLALLSDCLIAISPRQREEIARYLRIGNDDKLVCIPLGFGLDKFVTGEAREKRKAIRHELHIPEEAVVIATAGRLTAIKNQKMFIESACRVAERVSRARVYFLIVGDGELKKELLGYAESRGLKDAILFCGWRRDMEKVYCASDIIALTSLNEGTPVSLIEALASGIPVVATDVGGVSDVVRHDETGFLVSAGDTEAFARALLTLADNPSKRAQFGMQGKKDMLARYTKKRLIRDIVARYKKEAARKLPE